MLSFRRTVLGELSSHLGGFGVNVANHCIACEFMGLMGGQIHRLDSVTVLSVSRKFVTGLAEPAPAIR